MDYKKIIHDAWKLAEDHRYLQWYAFVPMMASLLVAMVYVPFRYGPYFVHDFIKIAKSAVLDFYEQYTSITILGVIIFLLALVIYIFFKAFFEGGLIGMINHIIDGGGRPIPKSLGFAYAVKTYFRLLKLHAITSLFNPFYIIMIMSLLHEGAEEIFTLLFWPALIIFIINVFIELSVSYSDYSMVMYNKSVMASLRNSIHIVIFNLRETLFVFFIIVLIIARAALNLLILFLIPTALIWIGLKLTVIFPKSIIISFITLICLVAYFYLVKLATFLTIFTHSIWVYTLKFLMIKTKVQLNVIEDEHEHGADHHDSHGHGGGHDAHKHEASHAHGHDSHDHGHSHAH